MRKHLIWALGLALAAASVATAAAAPNTQTITAKVRPKKLPKRPPAKPIKLFVDVSATNPGNPFGVPNPTTLAKVDFDKDLKYFQKGLARCDPNGFTAATTTQQARTECGDALLGTGTAAIKVPTGPGSPPLDVNAVVTTFNGKGKTIVFHTYNTLSGGQTLVGKLRRADAAAGKKYGMTLTVPVPPLAGGTAVITGFNTNVKKTYRFRGKKRSILSSTCKDKKLFFQARFTDNVGQLATGRSKVACRQKRS